MEPFRALVLSNAAPANDRPSFVRNDALELVPVANKPILFHALEALRDAHIVDVALMVHPLTGDAIREAVGDGSSWHLDVQYVERLQLGLIDALLAARGVLSDSPVVVYPGSGILTSSLQTLCRRVRLAGLQALLPLDSVDDHGPAWGGVAGNPAQRPKLPASVEPVDSEDGTALSGPHLSEVLGWMSETEPPTPIDGVYVFDPAVYAAARASQPSWRGGIELTDVIERLMAGGGRVEARSPGTWWAYHGHANDLLEGNRLVLDGLPDVRRRGQGTDMVIEGRVAISPSAHLESTTVRGPAVIGPGARLSDAFVGPYTSVGPRARLHGVEVENSIVMADAEVMDLDVRISGSVIGEGATVNRDFSLPRVLELAVARGSSAMLG